jgi:hypothetical protein
MEITFTTPALLFPAVSLLLVAYTNRFLTLGSRIRALHAQYKENPDEVISGQITILKKRTILIRNMQALGVGSLIFMLGSLGISLQEISISVEALNLELSDMEKNK